MNRVEELPASPMPAPEAPAAPEARISDPPPRAAFAAGRHLGDRVFTAIVTLFGLAVLAIYFLAPHPILMWLTLPFVVFAAAYSRHAVSFGASQALFALLVVEMFNLVEPEGWMTGVVRLEEAAVQIAGELGFALKGAATGGGSDISFAGYKGTPGLDGLGPIGGLDHGPDEYVVTSSIVPRTALLAKLMMTIGAWGEPADA